MKPTDKSRENKLESEKSALELHATQQQEKIEALEKENARLQGMIDNPAITGKECWPDPESKLLHSIICIHHTDKERSEITCPCCSQAQLKRSQAIILILTEALENIGSDDNFKSDGEGYGMAKIARDALARAAGNGEK